MRKDLRVIHVVLSLDVGGLERVVLDLIREGKAMGAAESVICIEKPGTLANQATALGAQVISIDKPPGLKLRTTCQIRTILADLKPDVVHTHQVAALFYAGPAARRQRVPVVVHTEHGKHYAARLRTRLLGRLASRHAHRFFCVSDDLAAEVRACHVVGRAKISIVRNGIPTAQFAVTKDRDPLRQSLGFPLDAPVVGTVGRLNEVKRQDVLLRGFALVLKLLPEARLILIGDGPMRESLQKLTDDLGIASNVHFAGYQSEPHRYLQVMDAFALTSRSEGMPLAILEAWAAGVPVIASRVGGLPEMIAEGKTGLLFDFPNAELLAEGLLRILREKDLSAALRDTARHHVQTRFDSRVMAEEYARHYWELLNRKKLNCP